MRPRDDRVPRMLWQLETPITLSLLIGMIVAVSTAFGSALTDRTVTEGLIRLVFVVGLYIFVGNSGVVSFGHAAFMLIGAYATAWQDCCSMTKSFSMPGLPTFLLETTVPAPLATIVSSIVAAVFALVVGAAIMRLSGVAASIATFAVLAILNVVYSNWDSVTAGTSSIVGIPNYTNQWVALEWAVVAVVAAHLYQMSKFGLSLRASRDDEVAAKAAGVNIVHQRLIAFVISAFFVGASGGLYAHFLGTISVDAFYLDVSLITLAMLVIGGMYSLTGAVVGTLMISTMIEALRQLEKGVDFGLTTVSVPGGTQEIGLGVIMVLVLVFRQKGITNSREIRWPSSHRNSLARESATSLMTGSQPHDRQG